MASKPTTLDIAPGDGGFTLTIELNQVFPEQIVFRDEYDKTGTKVGRRVIEQGRLVIRAKDAAELKNRASQALYLLTPSNPTDDK